MSLSGIILKASDFQVKGKNVFINPDKINNVPGMLLIHATWCHHCVKFTSTFNEISDNIGNGYSCASIESKELENQDSLVTALNFQGYPTICFFSQTGMIMNQYTGPRDKKSNLDEICKNFHHCIATNF